MANALPPAAVSRRVALVAPSAGEIVSLLDSLLRDTLGRGHRVLCITPEAPGADIRVLRHLGAAHRIVDLAPPGIRLLADWKIVSALVALFKDWQPEVVMGVGSKPMIDAAIAGRRAHVGRVVSLLTGLPAGDLGRVGERRIAQSLEASDALIAYRGQDLKWLEAQGLLPRGLRCVVVPGTGVDVRLHGVLPLPPLDQGVTFLMMGFREGSRGAAQYAEAARMLKERGSRARYLSHGPESDSPDKVSNGALEVLDRSAEPDAALAAGRPVITSDDPGFRETIDETVSGCLVPAADAGALARTMESFVAHPDLIPAMARAARLKAERRFDDRAVNRVVLEVLGL
jgi:hypothetical protein